MNTGFPHTHLTSHHYEAWSAAASMAEQEQLDGVMKACCSDLESLSVLNPTAPPAAQMPSVKCHCNKYLQQTGLSLERSLKKNQHKDRGIY